MRVGTRISAATSALVAVSLSVYAFAELRSKASSRRQRVTDDARQLATTARSSLEATGVVDAVADARRLGDALTRANPRWKLSILPARLLDESPPSAQMERLRAVVEASMEAYNVVSADQVFFLLPLRHPNPAFPDGYEILGAVEVSRSTAHLDTAWGDDLVTTLPLLGLVVLLVVSAIMLLTRSLVNQPIAKLLSGIDDVAQGDLSSVLMSEREDEIGKLATRFNEMTFSLRESRAETHRQNAAKARLEERMAQTEKLATIGQLAAEIAHEVGTPLNVISGRAKGIAKRADDPQLSKNANIIAEQTGRITRIIQRLLDFTRRKVGTVERQPVNLNEVTLTSLDLLEGKLSAAKVRHSLARSEGLAPVRAHEDQVQQVLINLILNAIEAMPDGGSLHVETSDVVRRRPGLEAEPEQQYVVVEITDTGPGIAPGHVETIFEPFYTSKNETGGTGLGLAVSHGIIKDHDGWIEVESPPRRTPWTPPPETRTTFRLCLPAVAK